MSANDAERLKNEATINQRDYAVYYQWIAVEALVVLIALDFMKLYTRSKLLIPLRLWLIGNVIWRTLKTLRVAVPMTWKIIQMPWFPNCSTFDVAIAACTVFMVIMLVF